MAELLGLTVAAGGVILVAWLCRRYPYVSTIIVVAFSLRLAAAVVHQWVAPLPYGTADARTFERIAWEWAQGGLFDAMAHFNSASSYMYSWAASLLYAVTDRSALMLQAFNVVGGTLIVVHAYLIARALWGRRRAYTLAWIVAVFPFLVQISAVTHREVVIVYFLTLGLYAGVRWLDTERMRYLLAALALLSIGALFHGGMLAAVAGAMASAVGIAFWVLLRRLAVGRVRSGAAVGVFGVACVIGVLAYTGPPELSRVGVVTEVDPELVGNLAEARAREEAAYLEGMYPGSFRDLVVQTPVRVAYFLFTPFPWQVRGPSHAFALLDAMFYLFLFVGLWQSRARIAGDRRAVFLLAVTLVTLVAFALVTSNFGTALRHRAKFIPLLVALWATPVFGVRLLGDDPGDVEPGEGTIDGGADPPPAAGTGRGMALGTGGADGR